MPTSPAALLERARTAWQRISRSQQIALIVGVVVSVALVIGFIVWSQQPNYGVLFSNLQSQDASAIVAQLKTNKIPYQITSNGTAILVPNSMVDETRLMLAGNGLPSQGTVGFEIFDKANPLTMTDFTQQLDYQRGLQGELTRTIEQINGVNTAWVAIVLPQSSLYTASQQDPTASVTLKMDDGSTLDPGQVKAVMHLVASSVQGMKPENVTVVDTNGDNLSDAVNAASLSNGLNATNYGTALDVEHQYEQTLSQQAASMLNTVLGPGKAVVRVNALLNWDQLQQDSTTYQPQQNPVANQTTNNINTNGTPTTTGGIPGTGSNLVPTPTAAVTATAGNSYSQSQTNTVYDVSQTVAHLTKAPGSVQRLTVAVFLDGTYDATTISSIQAAVANAIGLNNTRGDQITVSAIPFNHSTDTAAQNALKAQQQQNQIDLIARSLALALAAAALLFFAWRATRRARPRPQAASVALVNEIAQIPGADGKPLAEISTPTHASDQPLLMTGNDTANFLAAARQRQMSEMEQMRAEEIRKGLIEVTKQHPDLIANVIQGWFDAER